MSSMLICGLRMASRRSILSDILQIPQPFPQLYLRPTLSRKLQKVLQYIPILFQSQMGLLALPETLNTPIITLRQVVIRKEWLPTIHIHNSLQSLPTASSRNRSLLKVNTLKSRNNNINKADIHNHNAQAPQSTNKREPSLILLTTTSTITLAVLFMLSHPMLQGPLSK
jgi:hypothetical protein